MTVTSKRNWLTPLAIPEGKVGEYEIKHMIIPAGEKVMMNNFRNQMMGKQKGVNHLIYDVPTKWHKLLGPTGTWMTDLPVEQRQMEECLKGMKGRVLVGGLGLGLAASILLKKAAVKQVRIVEISKEVVDLVGTHVHSLNRWNSKGKHKGWAVEIINTDLFEYLKCLGPDSYDYAFYDIWQSDSEGTFFNTVVPLIELSKNKIKHPPICWNEDVMRGQLLQSIQNKLLFLSPEAEAIMPPTTREFFDKRKPWQPLDGAGNVYWNWSVPYFKWWKESKPSEKHANIMAHHYARMYGAWDWEYYWTNLTKE